MSKRIILGISSEIGAFIGRKWLESGFRVVGTYRNINANVRSVRNLGGELYRLSLKSVKSEVPSFMETHTKSFQDWTHLVVSVGDLKPVCSFKNCNFDEWQTSIFTNFLDPLRLLHELLPLRSQKGPYETTVIFFSGGAINKPSSNYSAYSISKVALTKMTELLQHEIPNVKFVTIGPGWIKSQIHNATIDAGRLAGSNLSVTQERISTNRFEDIEKIYSLLNIIESAPIHTIGGRNISMVHDKWDDTNFYSNLIGDNELFKLRRKEN
jgi:NAD(P)-dependent dehydrogenase (short-subunit alcohol dehydrogenase family)